MKRFVAGLMALSLGLVFTVGCGGPDSTPKMTGAPTPAPGSSGGSTPAQQKEAAKDKIGQAAEPAS